MESTADTALPPDPPADASRDEPPTRDAPATSPEHLPCTVARVVTEHCGLCHGEAPLYGAPMALTRPEHFRSVTPDGADTLAGRVRARIHDLRRPMPPNTRPALPEADMLVLDRWLDAGMPSAPEACAPLAEPPPKDSDFEWEACTFDATFRAHGARGVDDGTPYPLPAQDDQYACFNFDVPWTDTVQAIHFAPLIDLARAVHHWDLYETSADVDPGSLGACSDTTERKFLATWAPGGTALDLAADVGLALPQHGARLQLEVHYNNPEHATDLHDRSGVRICATSSLRPHTAAIHRLGSFDITLPPGQTTDVVNTCTIASGVGDVHVLYAFPHMHRLGVHLSTTVRRADGSVDTLVDKPYDFTAQGFYAAPLVVHQGDVLTTTCTFQNGTDRVVKGGRGTADEMCLNHVIAWPQRSLTNVPLGKDCVGFIPSDWH